MVEQETRPPEAGSRSDGGGGSGLRHDCRGDRHRLVPLGRYTSHVPGTDGRKDTLALLQKFLTFFKSPKMGFTVSARASAASCKQCVISSNRQIAKTFHGAYEGPPDPNRITRTPESAFDGVPQPFAPHYFQVFDPVYNVSTVLVNMKSDVQGLPRFISQ